MRQIFVSSIVLLCLDLLFLYVISNLFNKQIYDVQKSPLRINFIGALLSYLFLIIGINFFILNERKSIFDAFILGMVIYGVYETTSYALLKEWKIQTVIMDTIWGGILYSLTTFITYSIIY